MTNDGQDALDAMSSEFVAEIKDDLASLEPALLTMEEKGVDVDDDLINHAFRSIHSIKGGAGFINFTQLSDLSHAMENVLMQIREKTLSINSEIVDALLSGFDKMRLLVEQMGDAGDHDFSEEKQALENIISKAAPDQPEFESAGKTGEKTAQTARSTPDHSDTATALSGIAEQGEKKKEIQIVKALGDSDVFKNRSFEIEKDRLDHALKSQKFVYAVHIRMSGDAASMRSKETVFEDINSIGDILYSDYDLPGTDNKIIDDFYCVVATILDLPLLSQVLEVNKIQITLVDRQFTDFDTILKGQIKKTEADETPPDKLPEPEEEPIKTSTPAKENFFPKPRASTASRSHTVRINVDLISRLMNRAGELVLSRNQLRPFMDQFSRTDSNANSMMQNLDMVTSDIQEAIMQMRMQPIIDLMGKYKRVVRDIARRISKKVDLVIDGADVEVDRSVLEKLVNPVTHLIRNCIDHGIEHPEERLAASKPETGKISIKAYHQGGNVHIDISDDGAGIDPQMVLSKAFERGLVTEDQLDKLTDRQKINLIFLPGFSTSEEITDISGRGVGMDVVKTNLERLRGHIDIDSVKGRGTTVSLIIPLTLAIVPSLIVSTGQFKFAIPQISIKEIIHLEPGKIHDQVEQVAGSEVLKLRGLLLPILRLRNILDITTYIEAPETGESTVERRKAIADRRQKSTPENTAENRKKRDDRRQSDWDETYIIILKLGQHLFGLCVDDLHDIEEVVVEPLSEYLKHLKVFAGATILGEGDVIMILDIAGIAAAASLKFDTIETEARKRLESEKDKHSDRGAKRNLIIFSSSKKEYFALELKDISRLEPVKREDIHYTGDLKYIEYNNNAVLLFSMAEFLPASEGDFDQSEIFAIFPKHLSAQMGVLASQIIDTVEITEEITHDSTCSDAVLGKIFIDDRMIQVLNHETFIQQIEKKAKQVKDRI
jgi:two-component system chemotaxis sensor kinase CheA